MAAAASHVVRIANARTGEGLVAVSPEARKKFWLDRARTAAIAKHTNAFKINEDVVIPLPRMGEYCDGIERINIELSIKNKLKLADALEAFFAGDLPLAQDEEKIDKTELLEDKAVEVRRLIAEVRSRWAWLLANLDAPANSIPPFSKGGEEHQPPYASRLMLHVTVFRVLQDHTIRVSWKREILSSLEQLFNGRAFMPIIERSKAIHKEVLKSRVWIALHMHAGDGNVHTNIPVNSDDYGMLQEANAAVARIMKFARELNGVISGEHSIGITKLEFLEAAEVQSFVDYKQRVDPEGRFNKGKLMPGGDLRKAYTPSFALIGHESLIMEQSEIGRIADSVKDYLRCGKCKPVCSTHVPRANLLYSPRNKILATSLLVEFFLYEEQTQRGISIKHFDEFSDVADHCTIYHKCLNPCPVDIDFGDVSIAMRNFLRQYGKKKFNPGTAASMLFLNATNPNTIKLTRQVMIGWGYKVQRLAHAVAKKLGLLKAQTTRPPSTLGKPALRRR